VKVNCCRSVATVTQGQGRVRPPFVMKLPGTGNQTKPDIVNAFVHVNDMTPTFLDYAGVQPPGSIYKGHVVHAIMGKSLKPFFEGKVEKVYAVDDDPTSRCSKKTNDGI
jgi:arylsulfatase A-like enzyme